MVAKFTKPTASLPLLQQHSKLITYFHELGNMMHCICYKPSELCNMMVLYSCLHKESILLTSSLRDGMAMLKNFLSCTPSQGAFLEFIRSPITFWPGDSHPDPPPF
ncbi:hypothetical protein L0F63_004892 [Massospora cicadina]|nr:hypothetical protein L0F63_004892 [Massospora cicadina]